ncbi:non-ribosomal peptide synthetase [Nonomuraea sp. 10N515B]|uniref:non-ribosomal peptide synthetase n=1 Tax=Nonomuraea sp. 10N515B TaxID=3457422 RepID=UPI003FCE5B2E
MQTSLEFGVGPQRELPDVRVHQLFEERVREHPDRVAAVCDGVAWTYDELNRRANQVAHALRERGVGTEDVVGVHSERHLEWLASVLAVFKAGGVYLPIEPHFPQARIAAMLSRSGCRILLRDDDPVPDHYPTTDLDLPVGADQLAYVYFTSGSTGEPKGAMCEHAGMLNHILAKIEDLDIGPGQVVAQTAPQCFDISLWQLVAPLTVGAQTLIVPQRDILDLGRFLDTVVVGGVEVLQVVPSYLEVMLSQLERQPRTLGRLRCVSVTGEAIKAELVNRWFASFPDITLVNAYGLTETSDDTNHEVLTGPPGGDRIPLGRPVRNVRIYLLDDNGEPVPAGEPGEIVFAGVCVGRGYINDPERTAAAFGSDPYRPGERSYRSGDWGRWLPDGKLEFLGRQDAQVKIRGFRIEIGEIENQLLKSPEVRDAAVVVAETSDGAKHLVAYFSGAGEPSRLGAELAAALPEYMVPRWFEQRDALPLTGNGKVDKKTLRAEATALVCAASQAVGSDAPLTSAELRLAEVWAEVLKIPADRISREDDFFGLGGTSLAAIRLGIALGSAVTLQDLVDHPVLADLASLIERNTTHDLR